MRSQQQRITLPKLKSEFKSLPQKGPLQIKLPTPQRYQRYNTECLSLDNSAQFDLKKPQKKSKYMKFSLNKERTQTRQKKIQLFNLLESNRESSIKRKEALTKIIDTRKSIRILVDYFQSKSQELKSINQNCYHSPRKFPVNMVELRPAAQDYQAIKKSFVGVKRKHKTDANEGINDSELAKKKKKNYYAPSFTIQNAVVSQHPQIQSQNRRKIKYQTPVHPPPAPESPTLIQIGRVRQMKHNKKIGSQKITHFGAWNVNPQETQYMI